MTLASLLQIAPCPESFPVKLPKSIIIAFSRDDHREVKAQLDWRGSPTIEEKGMQRNTSYGSGVQRRS